MGKDSRAACGRAAPNAATTSCTRAASGSARPTKHAAQAAPKRARRCSALRASAAPAAALMTLLRARDDTTSRRARRRVTTAGGGHPVAAARRRRRDAVTPGMMGARQLFSCCSLTSPEGDDCQISLQHSHTQLNGSRFRRCPCCPWPGVDAGPPFSYSYCVKDLCFPPPALSLSGQGGAPSRKVVLSSKIEFQNALSSKILSTKMRASPSR